MDTAGGKEWMVCGDCWRQIVRTAKITVRSCQGDQMEGRSAAEKK